MRRTKPVNLEDLHHAWAQFSETKQEDRLEHKILCYPYTLANTTLTLTLENSMEESILQLFKEELLTFLKDRLENDSLSLVIQMSESNGEKRAFTNKEKFEEMAKKNPVLLEIQKQFLMDPDF